MKTTLLVCITAALLAVPAGVALIDEAHDLPEELQDATGCESVRVIVNEDGSSSVYFYNTVIDENGDEVEEECDPLA